MAQTDQLLTPAQYKRRLAAHIMEGLNARVTVACCLFPLPFDARLKLLDDLELNRLGRVNRVAGPVRNLCR